jgi:hypothetical protein
MRDGTDQEGTVAGGPHRTAQSLAVHRRTRRHSRRDTTLVLALLGPGAARVRQGQGVLATTGTGPRPRVTSAAKPQGARSRASLSRSASTPEGAFAGHQVPAPQRVPPGTQPSQYTLRGTGQPLPDRGHRVVAHHQHRARRQRQHHQLMPSTSSFPPIGHLREPREQRRCRRHWLAPERYPVGPTRPTGQGAGLIDDTVHTSAAPETILRRSHLKDHQKPRSSVHPGHPPQRSSLNRDKTVITLKRSQRQGPMPVKTFRQALRGNSTEIAALRHAEYCVTWN